MGGSVFASKVFDIIYGDNLIPRQLVTFKKVNSSTPIISDIEQKAMMKRIEVAHTFVEQELFANGLSGGVHAVEIAVIKELCVHIGVQKADSFWDIGIGLPLLAFSLSAAAVNGTVLGTDIRKFFQLNLILCVLFLIHSDCLRGYYDNCRYLRNNPQ